MIFSCTDFYFKGERTYVHGTTIFESFRKKIREINQNDDEPFFVKNYKIHKEVKNNLTMKIFDEPELLAWKNKENIVAEMLCSLGENSFFVGLYEENISPVEKRVASNEKEFIKSIQLKDQFSGTVNLHKFQNHYDLIQAIVEANKQIHILSLPKRDKSYKVRWAAIMGYRVLPALSDSKANLVIDNIGIQKSQLYKMTLNDFCLDINGDQIKFKMCFSFDDY